MGPYSLGRHCTVPSFTNNFLGLGTVTPLLVAFTQHDSSLDNNVARRLCDRIKYRKSACIPLISTLCGLTYL
jgi:hypothetical protein